MVSNEKPSWYALTISTVPEATEAVEFAFNSLDALGTEINHLQKKASDSIDVVGYFNALPDEETIQDELHYALSIYGLTDDAVLGMDRREIQDTDWLHEWKKHWKPTEIAGFVIAPPWEPVENDEKIVIRIEPNMAFGTGTHETTQLCLKAIDENFVSGQSFLDIGTGTGILAIAAAKIQSRVESQESKGRSFLGQESETFSNIVACDLDVDSVAIAQENASLNGVEELVEFYVGSVTPDTPRFDFVCANLTIDVILPILPLLLEKTRTTLVLSGILQEQEEMIVSALNDSQTNDFRVEHSGEWISVVLSIFKN